MHCWGVDGESSDIASVLGGTVSNDVCHFVFTNIVLQYVDFAGGRSQVGGTFSVGRRLTPGKVLEYFVAVVEISDKGAVSSGE